MWALATQTQLDTLSSSRGEFGPRSSICLSSHSSQLLSSLVVLVQHWSGQSYKEMPDALAWADAMCPPRATAPLSPASPCLSLAASPKPRAPVVLLALSNYCPKPHGRSLATGNFLPLLFCNMQLVTGSFHLRITTSPHAHCLEQAACPLGVRGGSSSPRAFPRQWPALY